MTEFIEADFEPLPSAVIGRFIRVSITLSYAMSSEFEYMSAFIVDSHVIVTKIIVSDKGFFYTQIIITIKSDLLEFVPLAS
jgi:hypothetical protein